MNNSIKKGVVVAVILLFVSVSVIPSTGTNVVEKTSNVSFNGNTLYVGGNGTGNYSKIQDAINDSSNGDTVFVFDDSSPYYEYIEVDKSIILEGENKYTTIISGFGLNQHIVRITGDEGKFHGFTIQNSNTMYRGIFVTSNDNNIFGNILTNVGGGIKLKDVSNNKIHENEIRNSKGYYSGIGLQSSSYNSILNNNVKEFYFGILVEDHSCNNKVSGNEVVDVGSIGIAVTGDCNFNIVSLNYVSQTKEEAILVTFYNFFNLIYRNNIVDNRGYGVYLSNANFAIVKNNNFINNSCNAYFFVKRYTNLWIRNYWDNRNIPFGPQKIEGKDHSPWLPGEYVSREQYDWFPSRKPYNIGV
ncbi:MAG: right-handed parallel beta-helix repeat-containing protein [Thermoplasmatales archaeon]|nr:MAG: right-handed parallel beta-helix repeat-containing protein [Thermoplasmatales archaeon]